MRDPFAKGIAETAPPRRSFSSSRTPANSDTVPIAARGCSKAQNFLRCPAALLASPRSNLVLAETVCGRDGLWPRRVGEREPQKLTRKRGQLLVGGDVAQHILRHVGRPVVNHVEVEGGDARHQQRQMAHAGRPGARGPFGISFTQAASASRALKSPWRKGAARRLLCELGMERSFSSRRCPFAVNYLNPWIFA